MTVRTVLRKHEDTRIEVIGDYEGDTARQAQTAAIEANEGLQQAAFDGELELAAPPVKSLQFEKRSYKLS